MSTSNGHDKLKIEVYTGKRCSIGNDVKKKREATRLSIKRMENPP